MTASFLLNKQKWHPKWRMMDLNRSTLLTVPTISHKPQELSTKDAQCHNLESEAAEIFIRKSETISPLLSTPRSLCKNKASSHKVWGSWRLQSRHTQAGKKSFSLKEHDEEFWKQERDLRCLPALSFSVSLILTDGGGESALKQFDYREVIIFSPFLSPSLSLSLSVAHTHQTLLSSIPLCIAMNTNNLD